MRDQREGHLCDLPEKPDTSGSLRFLLLTALGGELLAKAHGKRHGGPSVETSNLFGDLHVATLQALVNQGISLPLRRFWWSFAARIWGCLSAYATPKFCLEMQDHMTRKMILQLASLSMRAGDQDTSALAAAFTPRLEAHSAAIHVAIVKLRG